MAKTFKQGWYTPKNPDKYVGDVNKIRYMSSWELKLHSDLDNNQKVLRWSSEEIAIPYIKPTDGKVHKYYPDYWIEYEDVDGNVIQEIIEVKPHKQTKRSRSKNAKQKLIEDVAYAVNLAKWDACQKFCDKYGITFRIMTEKGIFK